MHEIIYNLGSLMIPGAAFFAFYLWDKRAKRRYEEKMDYLYKKAGL